MPTYFLQLKLGHLFCNIYLFIFALNFQMRYWTSGLLEKVSEVSFDRLSATNYSWNLLTSFLDILHKVSGPYTPQNMKFSIKDFFSKCDQILNGKLLFLYSGMFSTVTEPDYLGKITFYKKYLKSVKKGPKIGFFGLFR